MPQINAGGLPRTEDELIALHYAVADLLQDGLRRAGDALALTLTEQRAHAAMRELLVGSAGRLANEGDERARFDRIGWREYLETEDGGGLDLIELTQYWLDGAAYAAEGVAPRERHEQPADLDDRHQRIREVIATADVMLASGASIFGEGYMYIWRAVAARAALDFGGQISAEGIQLLSRVTSSAIRNAVSLGELNPNESGCFAADVALKWLERRREFCPSRWRDLGDTQWCFRSEDNGTPESRGMILVPRDVDGTAFTPEHVVRKSKSGPGLSITIGAKGFEEQHHDFYEALTALQKMDVARWRRRNSAGNWGIVRARGAWIEMKKADIDAQLADLMSKLV